ncbi:MAG: type II toxin-antitoxin system VapC family toxin [Alphaproteobacteria bacterium]|nr:type II toxin-antitoxin system VapC family toxin [Alphaproteobacteria bacterium]
MIFDSSAIIAIIANEDEAPAMLKALDLAWPGPFVIAAPTFLETFIVMHGRKNIGGVEALDKFRRETGLYIESFHPVLARLAIDAYQRFYRPPARLNFGDCFSYALAKARNEPLLCKGEDFRNTDIHLVEY